MDLSELNRKIVETANQTYTAKAKAHGDDIRSNLWDDAARQQLRFVEIVRHIDLNHGKVSLLDVGCGSGGFLEFLRGHAFRGKYSGFDINDTLLSIATKKFPGVDFRRFDLIAEETTEKFDYVTMSGLFNLNSGQSLDWVKSFIERMYALTESTLVFNAISSHVNFQNSEMFYVDPAEILTFCITHLSRRVTIAHHNLPFNFTIAVFRDEELA